MARIGSSNDEDWYLTDLLGSVRDIADTTGAGINHLDYHTFGGVATETSPTDGDRYTWTGRERDVETGLQYNRARLGMHEQVPAERKLHLEAPQRLPHA